MTEYLKSPNYNLVKRNKKWLRDNTDAIQRLTALAGAEDCDKTVLLQDDYISLTGEFYNCMCNVRSYDYKKVSVESIRKELKRLPDVTYVRYYPQSTGFHIKLRPQVMTISDEVKTRIPASNVFISTSIIAFWSDIPTPLMRSTVRNKASYTAARRRRQIAYGPNPHARGYTSYCFGDFESNIFSAQRELDFTTAVLVSLEFLRSCNPEDPYGNAWIFYTVGDFTQRYFHVELECDGYGIQPGYVNCVYKPLLFWHDESMRFGQVLSMSTQTVRFYVTPTEYLLLDRSELKTENNHITDAQMLEPLPDITDKLYAKTARRTQSNSLYRHVQLPIEKD